MEEPDYLSTPFSYRIQKTLKSPVTLKGKGLHSGIETTLRLVPAEPNHGIVFVRTDMARTKPISAHYQNVVATDLATTLGHEEDSSIRVGTVEHLLSALFALGITNVLVEVGGPEIPILDGSATPFVKALLEIGAEPQPYSTATLKIYRPIRVSYKGTTCELLPRDRLRITTTIDFPHACIGLQTFALDLTPNSFKDELCAARTFGFLHDLEN